MPFSRKALQFPIPCNAGSQPCPNAMTRKGKGKGKRAHAARLNTDLLWMHRQVNWTLFLAMSALASTVGLERRVFKRGDTASLACSSFFNFRCFFKVAGIPELLGPSAGVSAPHCDSRDL